MIKGKRAIQRPPGGEGGGDNVNSNFASIIWIAWIFFFSSTFAWAQSDNLGFLNSPSKVSGRTQEEPLEKKVHEIIIADRQRDHGRYHGFRNKGLGYFRPVLRELHREYGGIKRMKGLKGVELGPTGRTFALLEFLRENDINVEGVGAEVNEIGNSLHLHQVNDYNEYFDQLLPDSLDFIIARLSLYPYSLFTQEELDLFIKSGSSNLIKFLTRGKSIQLRYSSLFRSLKQGGILISVTYEEVKPYNLTTQEANALGFEKVIEYMEYVEQHNLIVIVLRKQIQSTSNILTFQTPMTQFIRVTEQPGQLTIIDIDELISLIKNRGLKLKQVGNHWYEALDLNEIEQQESKLEEKQNWKSLEKLFWKVGQAAEVMLEQPQVDLRYTGKLVGWSVAINSTLQRVNYPDDKQKRQKQYEMINDLLATRYEQQEPDSFVQGTSRQTSSLNSVGIGTATQVEMGL